MIPRCVIRFAAFGIFASAIPMARAEQPVPRPAISAEATAAISHTGETLSAKTLSFTVKTIRVYLDDAGQPLHIFHTMQVVARRPDRIAVHVTGDDGSHDLFYNGKSASVFSPDTKEYAVIAAPGDIPSALHEVLEKLKISLPLVGFFSDSPGQLFLRSVLAGWQVGTAKVDGVACRHLFFAQQGGVNVELWVEQNDAAIPHRLIVTYTLLPGQPNFIAEFSNWNSQIHPAESDFVFQPPADAKQIALAPARAPGQDGSE
ncbi:MAG: DUF2092 domain-containing protein [Acetobacteraceae bacterium]|nr:DUF2092 domain-containing protein [Acetobacteraceae bacterium]